MAMIELMIAIAVLTFGLVGLLSMIMSSITNNSRNKLDTSGTMLAKAVIEQIAAEDAAHNQSLTIADCAGNSWTINTAAGAAPSGAGAQLYTSATAPFASMVNQIDFTQAQSSVPAGYRASFVTCDASGTRTTYDVRWNLITLSSVSKEVIVSARQVGLQNSIRGYRAPVTLRTIVGQNY